MPRPVTKDTFELEVPKFGRISKARIDLCPLAVFAVLRNTGESYLAISIYALRLVFGSEAYCMDKRFR